MAADPIHGHPPWALILVAVSVGESAAKAGSVWGGGQLSNSNSRSPSPSLPPKRLNVSGCFAELGEGREGDSSPACTLAWGKPNTPSPPPLTGYFLADGADMLWNQTLGQAWELLCHHFVVRLGGGKTGEEACPALGVPFSHPLSVLWLPRESLTPANPWAELGEGD